MTTTATANAFRLIGGGNHISLAPRQLVLTAMVGGRLAVAIVSTPAALAAGLVLREVSPFRREGRFDALDGGDDFEGSPSSAKQNEHAARRALAKARWVPLPKGGQFGGGDLVPAIPAEVVAEILA